MDELVDPVVDLCWGPLVSLMLSGEVASDFKQSLQVDFVRCICGAPSVLEVRSELMNAILLINFLDNAYSGTFQSEQILIRCVDRGEIGRMQGDKLAHGFVEI